jgi:hypothetical protein
VRIVLSPLANVGQKPAEHRAVDGVVTASRFLGFLSPALRSHGQLFKYSPAASANSPIHSNI